MGLLNHEAPAPWDAAARGLIPSMARASTHTPPRLLHAGRLLGMRDRPWHGHEGHELVLVTAGACRIACGGQEFACIPGTFALLPRGLPGYPRANGLTRIASIVWEAGDGVLVPQARSFDIPLDSRLARWIGDLCDLAEDPVADPAAGDALLLAVLTCVARIAALDERDAELPPALAEATRLLTADLTAVLDLPRLAARCGIGASHLARLFRQHHGCPPLRYQHRLRLRLAERLLRDPQLTVEDVGCRCGWSDPNYFGRVFRRHAGSPPGVWRGSRRPRTTSHG